MFPSKILLFGEYSLLYGSDALSVPYQYFFGNWSKSAYCTEMTYLLVQYANYLEGKQADLPFDVDLKRFRTDVAEGLYFESSIPISYGLGSSGALCAAFYRTYVNNPIPPDCDNDELPELKRHLSLLEGHFHHQSSGLDPLVSYTDAVIVSRAKEGMQKLESYSGSPGNVYLFLIDTKRVSHTGYNMQLFTDLLKEDYFLDELKTNYNPLVNRCISYYLQNRTDDFVAAVHKLSKMQLLFFEPMIPVDFLKYFQMAEESGKFSIKLCGSGGGGYLLGFTTNLDHVTSYFKDEQVKVITLRLRDDKPQLSFSA